MRILICVAMCALCGTALASPVVFDSHHTQLRLDVSAHSAAITDSGSLSLDKGWNWFYVNGTAQVQKFMLDGRACTIRTVQSKDTSQLPPDLRKDLASTGELPDALIAFFESSRKGKATFSISFSAVFDEDVANVRFSRESVGREVSGTILNQGAYLSPSSYYYPQGAEELCNFSLTADIPAGWEAISDGNKTGSIIQSDRKVQSWENPYRNDGCIFMAAPYVSLSGLSDSTPVTCLFFDADTSLAPNYLKATAEYVKMYSDLIGPYPFKQFTVAENFFPTGYGMPGWTLIGQTVLRLPFIIGTSLGHEVLHNWWGNSVYVDYSRGNWCEGLTVYGADYRYKLAESPFAARQYRKDILKEYVSYVSKDKDFPLREFKSRTSPNTRAVGYNKAMMVFHMIEEEIGSKAFLDAWKLICHTYLGKQVGWEEWIQAFQSTSGQDLSFVIPQWIDRAGAPVLGVKVAGTVAGPIAGTKLVTLQITQTSGLPYHLRVPIEVESPAGKVDTIIDMAGEEFNIELVTADSSSITVDPDYHLFRRLYPEEVEPIISAVLGAPQKAFILGRSDEALASAFKEFAGSVTEDSAAVVPETSLASMPKNAALVMLNPTVLPEYVARQIKITADSVRIGEQTFARAGSSFVLSGQNSDGTEKCWVVLTEDAASLPRLGQLVPHYGKYSYLAFSGSKNIAKGQWEVTQSPLRVVVH